MSSRRGMCPMRLETGDRIVVKRADWKGLLEKKVMSALGQKHMCGAKGDVRFTPMCGRLRVGKDFLERMQHWSVQPCVRPFSAARRAAGHNALRGSSPDQ